MATAESLSKTEFWQRAATTAFATWAIAIPIGAQMIRASLAEALQTQAQQSKDFNSYVLVMERRITLIEERQASMLQTQGAHGSQIDVLKSSIYTRKP